jgi:hypothetical protein
MSWAPTAVNSNSNFVSNPLLRVVLGLDIRHSHARIIIEFGEMNFRLSMGNLSLALEYHRIIFILTAENVALL